MAGKLKAGAGYGYTKVLGYHPILTTLGRSQVGPTLEVPWAGGRDRAQSARGRRPSENPNGRAWQRGTAEHTRAPLAVLRRAAKAG